VTLPIGPFDWVIDGRKISAYLLNTEHSRGRSKAKYLMSFGFTPEDPGLLAGALVRHALLHSLSMTVMPSFDPLRVVCEGTVAAPDGREMPLRTIWEAQGPTEMRLITAVPLTR
jgi:hypothetical protein